MFARLLCPKLADLFEGKLVWHKMVERYDRLRRIIVTDVHAARQNGQLLSVCHGANCVTRLLHAPGVHASCILA
jgi:hypothetical protein